VTYMAFDLLGAAGHDLRGLPLLVRKACSRDLLPGLGPLRLAEHIPSQGEALLAQVAARGLEGVVAKRADSTYRPTRSRDWLKIKREPEGDFAVCGYTAPKRSRPGFGALHLCVREDGAWRWAGKVGSGFDDQLLTQLRAELDARPAWQPTFPRPRAAPTRAGSSPSWWSRSATASGSRRVAAIPGIRAATARQDRGGLHAAAAGPAGPVAGTAARSRPRRRRSRSRPSARPASSGCRTSTRCSGRTRRSPRAI